MAEESKRSTRSWPSLRRQQTGHKQIYYRSEAMRQVMEVVRTVSAADVTVLITGESGTGKELVANEVHQRSERSGQALYQGQLCRHPSELLESELFGYEEEPSPGRGAWARRACLSWPTPASSSWMRSATCPPSSPDCCSACSRNGVDAHRRQ